MSTWIRTTEPLKPFLSLSEARARKIGGKSPYDKSQREFILVAHEEL